MAARSRRPGESIFDHLDRTTDPRALMHLRDGPRPCCRLNGIDKQASDRAHTFPDSARKEQL